MCPTHGRFRHYMDFLYEFKNWCIVMVTVSIVPLGLVVFESGIDLNWMFYVGAIVTIPCFPPVMLSIIWVKATSQGLIAGKATPSGACFLVTLSLVSHNIKLNEAQNQTATHSQSPHVLQPNPTATHTHTHARTPMHCTLTSYPSISPVWSDLGGDHRMWMVLSSL